MDEESASHLAAPEPAADGWEAVALPLTSEMNGRTWKTVAASSDDCSIFPPNLHEGLHQRYDLDQTLAAQPPPDPLQKPIIERYFLLSEKKEEDRCPALMPLSNSAKRMMGSGLQLVRSKVSARGGGRGEASGICAWSFAALAGMVGMAGIFLYLRRRHQREKDFLLFLIREKDQKIGLLLHQIAELNAVLAAHRKVPVLRRF
ncbi:hypothetical protein AXF42_Ash015916 [Apostasia shenzhenica]|uniref:Uncharacterized protein n=1 Tax=Apostasia shenzhenica TaxID=1088818 RepID=A0A2I0AWD7_9ASPA|nr:hypothetical protein AXF42_Ash015916 [Apostasia shenzhenica]